jgi:hypothetical protein
VDHRNRCVAALPRLGGNSVEARESGKLQIGVILISWLHVHNHMILLSYFRLDGACHWPGSCLAQFEGKTQGKIGQ